MNNLHLLKKIALHRNHDATEVSLEDILTQYPILREIRFKTSQLLQEKTSEWDGDIPDGCEMTSFQTLLGCEVEIPIPSDLKDSILKIAEDSNKTDLPQELIDYLYFGKINPIEEAEAFMQEIDATKWSSASCQVHGELGRGLQGIVYRIKRDGQDRTEIHKDLFIGNARDGQRLYRPYANTLKDVYNLYPLIEKINTEESVDLIAARRFVTPVEIVYNTVYKNGIQKFSVGILSIDQTLCNWDRALTTSTYTEADFTTLFEDLSEAIIDLANNGLHHTDLTLNNLGFRGDEGGSTTWPHPYIKDSLVIIDEGGYEGFNFSGEGIENQISVSFQNNFKELTQDTRFQKNKRLKQTILKIQQQTIERVISVATASEASCHASDSQSDEEEIPQQESTAIYIDPLTELMMPSDLILGLGGTNVDPWETQQDYYTHLPIDPFETETLHLKFP